MKNFLTAMLGSLVALIIFCFGAFFLVVGIAGAIVSMSVKRTETVSRIESGSYLVIDLSTNINDAPPEFDFSGFSDNTPGPLQLREVTQAISRAAVDNRIAGILLKGSLTPEQLGSGYGALQEVRAALLRFESASKKPVKAYLDFAATRDYYLASAADEIEIDPYGLILMPGLATEPVFYAGAFQKYGVGIQVTRVGKYKDYVEPFIRQDLSPEAREETQRLLDDLWGSILGDVGRTRHLTPAQIQGVVDSEGIISADAAKKAGLVDKIAYRDQLIDELKADTGRKGSTEPFKQISLPAYVKLNPAPSERSGRRTIAVVYAEGDIVDGEGDPGDVGGDRFSRELRKLREDDSVKAIVLRVNSPGGSATAAETIQREIRLIREAKKPVIVSMGSYAASGGYWISAYGDRIFAEPTTITGSIGVFGIQFDIQKLANDFGITFDRVKTGKFADALTITRPKTPEEMGVFQRLVDWIYDQFIAKVAAARKLDPDRVREIAQGRVWSGQEAVKLHLADEIGGLSDAIRYAAKAAGLHAGYNVLEYPQKKDLAHALAELFGKVMPDSDQSKASSVLGQIESRFRTGLSELAAYNDPEGVYARLPIELTIR